MQSTLTLRTRVLPGHRVEVVAPELPEGDMVEVAISPLEETKPEETAEDWIDRFEVWVRSHDHDVPRLPEEAFHRAYYYEDPE